MGLPPSQSPSHHLYSQAIQLKLYQAFIFSVPILFSIILILLFYLFYLKRRRGSNFVSPSSSSLISRRSAPHQSNIPLDPLPFEVSLKKEELKDKLSIIMFDEALRARDSQCCVCLGEFEMKEQLHQIPTCNHIFHIECIHNWLHANTTCPLCRCSIVSSSTTNHPHSNNADHQSPSISINSSSSSSSSSLGPNLNQLEPSDHDHFHDDRVLSEV